MLSSYLHLQSLAWSLVSLYFWFMIGKSSWVPSCTQDLFSTCCRWYCIPWVMQELLLSHHGRGVRPRARLFYVVLSMMLLLDLITNRHVFGISVCGDGFKTILLPLLHLSLSCNNSFRTLMYVELLVNLCNTLLVCWIMYDLGCMLGIIWDP